MKLDILLFTAIIPGAILNTIGLGDTAIMRIFKVKGFIKWARKERLSDSALLEAVAEMRQGLIDARLGCGVCKKRIGIAGRGKRGGVRTIVAFQSDKHTFFMYGFTKNERDNIDQQELKGLRVYADKLLELKEAQIEVLVKAGELFEVR